VPLESKTFGALLKALRKARGLQQKQVIDRIPYLYSTERSYRRIESGERTPDRKAVIEILVKALDETDAAQVDRFLESAGFEGLTESEQKAFGLTREDVRPEHPQQTVVSDPGTPIVQVVAAPSKKQFPWFNLGVVTGSLLLAVAVAATAAGLPMWFVVVTSILYAGLYAVSILLESAYQSGALVISRTAVYAFCFILVTSVLAFRLDAWIVAVGGETGLEGCLAVFVSAAAGQFVAVRKHLSANAVVEASFQAHTAQSAHLKNTVYFLTAVLFFWLPTVHTMLVIESKLRIGNRDYVAAMLSIGGTANGAWYPHVSWLWMLFIAVFGATLLMRSQLLDNLKPHPRRNRYLILFYIRALLYFLLSVVCLEWYSLSLDKIARSLAPAG